MDLLTIYPLFISLDDFNAGKDIKFKVTDFVTK